MASAQSQAVNNQQANMLARMAVLQQSTPMIQSIWSSVETPATKNIININPRYVGLVKGFLVKLSATVTNASSGSSALSLTANGPANLLQNINFVDLQNYTRINTPGIFLSALNTARQGKPFLSSTATDSPMGYGSNATVIKAPATIATGATGTIYMYYWVPLAYSESDLTGSIYMGVVNATAQLQLTIAQAAQAFVASTADPTLAIYQGAGAVSATLTNVNVNVYQSFLDQLPKLDANNLLLPVADLSTIYELKNTALSSINVAQDFNIGYSNFRHFLSTTAIFDNETGGAYPTMGTDINYWAIRSANYTDLIKIDPFTQLGMTRRIIDTDFPVGMYYFDHRAKPIYTSQFGNMNLVLNPSTVNTNAQVLVGWEAFANVNNLVNAGSLASS